MKIKTIEIDYDSLEDIGKWINILKSQYSTLRKSIDPDFTTKNDRIKKEFNACNEIINTDITKIYSNLELDPDKKYYVYAHCDSGFKIALKKNSKTTFAATLGMKYVPFYIGKGTGNRAFDLNRNESHRKVRQKLHSLGKEVDVFIIKDNLSELEALCLESKLIDIFGLLSQRNGYLVNLDEGINSKERKELYWKPLSTINSLFKEFCKTS